MYEAWVTFGLFFVLLGMAFAGDRYKAMKEKAKKKLDDEKKKEDGEGSDGEFDLGGKEKTVEVP